MDGVPGRGIKYGGFVVAAIGFLTTRYTVLESIDPTAGVVEFLLGRATFLVLGLGLTVFGISLAVSSYDKSFVNTVATWSILGATSMILVLGLTFVGTGYTTQLNVLVQSSLVANVLIGGSIGGALTGIRTAMNGRHRRELSEQADRLTVLNRILRHEVLNKINVIHGYATLGVDDEVEHTEGFQVIQRNANRIDVSISELRAILGPVGECPVPTDVKAAIQTAIDDVCSTHSDVTVTLDVDAPDDLQALADAHLDTALRHLLQNAVVHTETESPHVAVGVSATENEVRIEIADEGPGIPDRVAAVVEERRLPEYDDPTTGFGLTLVRLLVGDKYGGSVSVESGDDGSVVTVTLGRPGDNILGDDQTVYGVPPRFLGFTAVSALVAGVVMGTISQAVFGSFSIVGALYGVANVGVGWLLHIFHSLIFGILFAVAVAYSNPANALRRPGVMVALGVAYGVFLWLFAAGVVMPLWLNAVGVPSTVPMLSLPSLLAHVAWGVVLGGAFAIGIEFRR